MPITAITKARRKLRYRVAAGLVAVASLAMTTMVGTASATLDDLSPQQWSNFLSNPSFEAQSWWWTYGTTNGWRPVNNSWAVSFGTTRAAARQGSFGAQVSTSAGGGSIASDIPGSFGWGTNYEFQIWARVPDGVSIPSGGFQGTQTLWGDGSAPEKTDNWFTLKDHNWTLLSVPLQLKADHASLRAELYLGTLNTPLFLDEASVVRTGLVRGSFEGGAGNWRPLNYSQAVNFAVYGGGAQEGWYFAEMNTYQPGGSVAQDVYPSAGVPGSDRSYCFSAYVRAPWGAVSGTLALWTLGGQQQEVNSTSFTANGTWTQYQTCIRPNNAASGLRAEIYMNTPYSNLDVDHTDLV